MHSGFLNLGYSTPFLSLGASYMYSSLASAKAAVISIGEEIATMGLPSRICPLVFVFTGTGNGMINCFFAFNQYHSYLFQIKSSFFRWYSLCLSILNSVTNNSKFLRYRQSVICAASPIINTMWQNWKTWMMKYLILNIHFLLWAVSQGAQEIFKLLPHTFVEPSRLPHLLETVISFNLDSRVYLAYSCKFSCLCTSTVHNFYFLIQLDFSCFTQLIKRQLFRFLYYLFVTIFSPLNRRLHTGFSFSL